MTAVKTEHGLSMLLIPRTEDVETKIIKTAYSSAAGTAYVIFSNVLVPKNFLMGEMDKGLKGASTQTRRTLTPQSSCPTSTTSAGSSTAASHPTAALLSRRRGAGPTRGTSSASPSSSSRSSARSSPSSSPRSRWANSGSRASPIRWSTCAQPTSARANRPRWTTRSSPSSWPDRWAC